MAMNMIDYLRWRGDLTFAQSRFNEVDNLLLCYLVYVNLDDIAPEIGQAPMTIRDLANCFFQQKTEEELKKDRSFIRFAPAVLYEMAKTERFGDLLVQNYINKVESEKVLQFAAMEILLGDGSVFVAYRGTDDTIVGWKEDFFLSRGVVPAEEEAVAYLEQVCTSPRKSFFDKIRKKKFLKYEPRIRIGGHSKGGHLALYAAACCREEIQERILEVYNNDGPGFVKEFLNSSGALRIRDRIRYFVPECSIIGLLLNHSTKPVIVQSTQKMIMQHNGFSWQVEGPGFVRCENLSNLAVVLDEVIKEWLLQIPDEQKEQVICDMFSVLEATGAETLTELQDGGIRQLRVLMKQVDMMDSGSKEILQELLKLLLQKVPQIWGFTEKRNLLKKK